MVRCQRHAGTFRRGPHPPKQRLTARAAVLFGLADHVGKVEQQFGKPVGYVGNVNADRQRVEPRSKRRAIATAFVEPVQRSRRDRLQRAAGPEVALIFSGTRPCASRVAANECFAGSEPSCGMEPFGIIVKAAASGKFNVIRAEHHVRKNEFDPQQSHRARRVRNDASDRRLTRTDAIFDVPRPPCD